MYKDYNKIYFIGIGGIGMSSIALYFINNGKQVAGYDQTKTHLTTKLSNLGANIHYDSGLSEIPEEFKKNNEVLIIYTPAISLNNVELSFFFDNNFIVLKRSEILGYISRDKFCIAIAGTHGKTTTATILSHILFENNIKFISFIGGISENYDSNFIQNGKDVILVEADEFDRSFLTLNPNIACITSVDSDHLDVYNSNSELQKSFNEFASKLEVKGILFKHYDIPINGVSYGFNENAEYSIINYRNDKSSTYFDIVYEKENSISVKFNMPGKHNACNALVAFAIARLLKIKDECIVNSLNTFKGVKRRFSYILKSPKILIDDYAHHPNEIKAIYESVKSLYPRKSIMAIFQPHLYSRTRDFMNQFAQVLSKFDEVTLLDIYPAREEPLEGINSRKLLNLINNLNKNLVDKQELKHVVQNSNSDVFVVMGAGDISDEVYKIKDVILN
jgi:UDP-N-acetylmuramate--alanine ligase